MTQSDALDVLHRYYAAFNAGDRETFFGLLTGDVIHDINQGGSETGVAAFRAFMDRMDRCYRERIEDLVLMADESGTHAAAEFMVRGEYLATDEGLPPARGQKYLLPAGAFFTLRDGRVARVTMYYNLQEWLRQIS
ncbi:MAG TPA: ketosteroid isomerase-related protein [Verrucomicrobiales bacterium]|nr:ketosteroid isomerase-related protein [Verrucomicrobiales bacterium]